MHVSEITVAISTYLFTTCCTAQERPTTLLKKVVRVLVDGLHDRSPVQIDRPLAERNVHRAERRLISDVVVLMNVKPTLASSSRHLVEHWE